MYFAGIDLGSRSAKIVVMEDKQLLFHNIYDTTLGAVRTAKMLMDNALGATGLKLSDINNVIATGYGRVVVPFASKSFSDITCHVKGVNWLFPSCRTIIELGGQDSKAIKIDGDGKIRNFVMNDRCAAGNGRFLEVMADFLQIPVSELGPLSRQSRKPIAFSATCTIFIKSMALSLLRSGEQKADIVSGVHAALANQCVRLLNLLGMPIEKDVVLCGGVAKNVGIVDKVSEGIGMKPLIPDEPQLTGAIGAAVLARRRYLAEQKARVTS